MTRSFAITYDYRCPYARIAHDHVVAGLRAGADWDVTFLPFSLGQAHVHEGQPSVWERPEQDSGIVALQASIAVRVRAAHDGQHGVEARSERGVQPAELVEQRVDRGLVRQCHGEAAASGRRREPGTESHVDAH